MFTHLPMNIETALLMLSIGYTVLAVILSKKLSPLSIASAIVSILKLILK